MSYKNRQWYTVNCKVIIYLATHSIVALKTAVILSHTVLLFASSMMFDVVTSFVSSKSKEAICLRYVFGALPCLAFSCSGVYNANIFAGSLLSRCRTCSSHPSLTAARMSSFGTRSNRGLIEQICLKLFKYKSGQYIRNNKRFREGKIF